MPWTEIEVQTGEGEEKIKIYMPATKKEAIEHLTNVETAEITFWPSAGITQDMVEAQYSWATDITIPAQKTVKSLAFNPNNLGTAMLTPFAGGGGVLPISTTAVDTLRNIAPTIVARDEETNSGTLVAFSPGVWLYFFTEGRGIRYIELNNGGGGGGGPTPKAVNNQPSNPFNDYILSIDQIVFGVTDPATVLGVAVPFWWDDDLGSNQIGPLPILHSPIFDAVYALLRWLGADQFLARKTALAVTLYPAVSRKPVDVMQVYFSPYPTIMGAVLGVINAITNGHPVQYAPIAFNLSPDTLSFTQTDLDKLHQLLTTEFDYRVSKLFDTHTYPVPLSYASPAFLAKNSLNRPYLAIEKPLFEAYQKVLNTGSDVDATVATVRFNMAEGALSLFGLIEWLIASYSALGDICYNASALRNLNPPDDYLADFYAQACSSLKDTRGITTSLDESNPIVANFRQKIVPFLNQLKGKDSAFFERWLTQRSSADVGTAMSDLFKEANDAGLIYYIPSTTVGYAKTSHIWLEGKMFAGVKGYLTIQFEATKTYLLDVFGKKFIETTDVKKQLEKGKALANAFAQALGLTNRFVIDTETEWKATLANGKEVTIKGPVGAIAELEDRYIIYAFIPFKNTCPFTNLLKFHWNEEQKAWEVIPLNPDDPTTVWDIEKEMQDTGCSALMLTADQLMARFGYTIADSTMEPQIAPIWAVALIVVAVAGAYMAHAYIEGMKALTQTFTLYTKTTLQIARYVHEGQEYSRDVSNNATTIAQSTANLVLYYCTKNPDSELCQDALKKYLDIAKQAQDINQQTEKDINRGNEILQHIYEVYSDNYRRTVEEMSKASELFSLEGLKTLALYGLGFVVGIAVIPPLLTTIITNSLKSASRG